MLVTYNYVKDEKDFEKELEDDSASKFKFNLKVSEESFLKSTWLPVTISYFITKLGGLIAMASAFGSKLSDTHMTPE